MERITPTEARRFSDLCPVILKVLETALDSVFDEQGTRWTDFKLRVGAAMSAVELARNSRLQARRALWHASMVLMTLRGAAPPGSDHHALLESLADLAHTLSLVSIACDSEVASADSVVLARTFLSALGGEEVSWASLLAAHEATHAPPRRRS
jgi:hypothetical protein